MKKRNKIWLIVLGALILIQFIPYSKNSAPISGLQDINHAVPVSPAVKNILETSCYDCHSDSTHYYWYFNIQPIAWWLNNHIVEGKRELNFSIFNSYSSQRKHRKFQEIIEQVSSDEMPVSSYILIHNNAKLTSDQKLMLIEWAEAGKRAEAI